MRRGHEVRRKLGVVETRRPVGDIAHGLNVGLERDHAGRDARIADLQDSDRRLLVTAQVARHREPTPFEPSWMLSEAARRCGPVPLVHTPGIEEQDAFDGLGASAMRVAVDDRVGIWKPASQRPRQASMRPEVAEAQSPKQGVRLWEPATALAVHDHDPFSLHGDVTRGGEIHRRSIVVTPHGFDRRQPPERRERVLRIDVAGVEDEVDPREDIEESIRKLVEKLGTVRVRYDSDPRGHVDRATFYSRAIVNRTINGARLRTAAMRNTTLWHAPKATAPMSGPTTPPI